MSKLPEEFWFNAAVTVDMVVLTIIDDELSLLTVTRGRPPFKGELALPGGFLEPDETAEQAVRRELQEETGVEVGHIEQLATYTKPDRDPRGRTVSIAYLAFAPFQRSATAGDDAAQAQFIPINELGSRSLAFDHQQIVDDALERARNRVEYTTLATAFLPGTFTLRELRDTYETICGTEIDASNFSKKMETFLEPTGETSDGWPPARMYRMRPDIEVFWPPLRLVNQ